MNHFPTWTDLENMELAFFPIGSTEQHGFHLPTNTDSIIATAIAQQLAPGKVAGSLNLGYLFYQPVHLTKGYHSKYKAPCCFFSKNTPIF